MVLVSHEHKFIFLKTTKTAGTSIEMALERFCTPADHVIQHYGPEHISEQGIVAARGDKKNGGYRYGFYGRYCWRSHMSAAKVRRAVGLLKWYRYKKIATIRNPFDRLISLFIWETKDGPRSKEFSEQRAAFRDYIISRSWNSNYKMVHIGSKSVVDHYIRYENMREDFKLACSSLGIDDCLPKITHQKNLKRRRLSDRVCEYYDKEMIDIVLETHDWVFDYFGYDANP